MTSLFIHYIKELIKFTILPLTLLRIPLLTLSHYPTFIFLGVFLDLTTFLDPVCQIAVDNTRNILYGRTEHGNIQVISLYDVNFLHLSYPPSSLKFSR